LATDCGSFLRWVPNITAVMSSSVDSRKVSRRDAVAEHLLHWAVADRHAAGDGEMTNVVGAG